MMVMDRNGTAGSLARWGAILGVAIAVGTFFVLILNGVSDVTSALNRVQSVQATTDLVNTKLDRIIENQSIILNREMQLRDLYNDICSNQKATVVALRLHITTVPGGSEIAIPFLPDVKC